MALYLISYDIKEKNRDEYEDLWAELKTLKATKILFSEWLVSGSTGNAENLYNTLMIYIQQNDRLLVQEVLRGAYWDKLLISDDRMRELLKSARG